MRKGGVDKGVEKVGAQDRVIETSTIRLSADETRLIVRAAANKGKPLCDYRAGELVALGLLETVKDIPPDRTEEIAGCWKNIENAVKNRSVSELRRAVDRIERYANEKKQEGYALTPLGHQVARGITVRLNGQFAKPWNC